MIKISNEFAIGDIVYFKTDPEQLPRMVTQITLCGNGGVLYGCSYGECTSNHYAIELSLDRNVILATTG